MKDFILKYGIALVAAILCLALLDTVFHVSEFIKGIITMTVYFVARDITAYILELANQSDS